MHIKEFKKKAIFLFLFFFLTNIHFYFYTLFFSGIKFIFGEKNFAILIDFFFSGIKSIFGEKNFAILIDFFFPYLFIFHLH